jgi:hypothetical protein
VYRARDTRLERDGRCVRGYRSNRPTLWICQLLSSSPGQIVHP